MVAPTDRSRTNGPQPYQRAAAAPTTASVGSDHLQRLHGPSVARNGQKLTSTRAPKYLNESRASPQLVGGFTSDFIGRPDGLIGLARAYGMRFRAVRPLSPALKYQALASRGVDVIDGYSTDGLLARYDLVTLSDDKGFFPPYDAAAVVSPRLARLVSETSRPW